MAEPQVTHHAVTYNGNDYKITTVSNSTIYAFQVFKDSNIEISFNVTGPPGTSGFCYVTIPTELWSGSFTVTIGNNKYTISDPPRYENNILFNLTYDHPNQVKITSTHSFPTWDINQDGTVDISDIFIVAIAFGSTPGSPCWNPQADINLDMRVDMKDITMVAIHFGEKYV